MLLTLTPPTHLLSGCHGDLRPGLILFVELSPQHPGLFPGSSLRLFSVKFGGKLDSLNGELWRYTKTLRLRDITRRRQ